jgi:branched-chain amino acid transport system substrate-binding protein
MTRIGAALVAVVALGACGEGADPGEPVPIALLTPKSGRLGGVGESFERVYRVAIDNINGAGGIDGRLLELIVEDTTTDADVAAQRFAELAAAGVVAIVGPVTSSEVAACVELARDLRVPYISPSSTAPSLSRPELDDGGYLFRNVPDDDIQGVAMAYYLFTLRAPPVTRVAVLFEGTEYGRGLKDAFRAVFEGLGGTIPEGHELEFTPDLDPEALETEAGPIIDRLAALDPLPSLVILIALETDVIAIVQAWAARGPDRPPVELFMTDGARTGSVLAEAGGALAGMCGTSPTFPVNGVSYRHLKLAYEEVNDDVLEEQVFAPNVWDATHLIGAALVKQASDDPDEPLGGPRLRDAITAVSRGGQTRTAAQWRNIVRDLRVHRDIDYDGAAGPNDFDATGQAVGPYEVWCVSADGTRFEQELFLTAQGIQDFQR